MKIVDKIEHKDSKAINDKDTMLKEKFVDGIRDDSLRREMRRYLHQYKIMKFPEFRETMMDSAEDYRTRNVQVTSEAVGVKHDKSVLDTLQEIRGMFTSQKAQINSQAQQLKPLTQKVNKNKDVPKAPAVIKRG